MIRALCALFVLCAISWSTSADNAKPLTTILLIARAELPDPNFKDSVVRRPETAVRGIVIAVHTHILAAAHRCQPLPPCPTIGIDRPAVQSLIVIASISGVNRLVVVQGRKPREDSCERASSGANGRRH